MQLDSEVALLGTGVAPLVAASHLLAEGKSVLVLNPDRDFFLEDSELPFDPVFPAKGTRLDLERLRRSQPEYALGALRPDFPGAVEFWSGQGGGEKGFHDQAAPHVRSRSRLWVTSQDFSAYEDFYVESEDAGFNPQILEGLQVLSRFPGASASVASPKGMMIHRLCDVDVTRYRNGLLEFVRERAGRDRVVCDAAQIELMPGGVRFHSEGGSRTARLSDGMLVFWTPRLSQWIQTQAKRAEKKVKGPAGVRHWEQWSLMSRQAADPGVIGVLSDMAVWAEFEGAPADGVPGPHRIGLLRAGPLATVESSGVHRSGAGWASGSSFQALSELFYGFLKWERLSVRAMRPRAILEWKDAGPWWLLDSEPRVRVIPGSDGPLVDVVRTARSASIELGSSGGGSGA